MTVRTRRSLDFRVSWLLMGIGLICGIYAVFMLVTSVGPAFMDALVRAPCATPCSQAVDLKAGTYVVFEEVGRSRTVGPFSATTQGPTTISPADVAVTSANGGALDMAEPSSSQSMSRNGGIYAGVVSFYVPEAGRYRVTVDAPGEARVLVAPGLGQTFLTALPGIGVAGTGFAIGLTGLVLLILAWSRRRSVQTSTGANGPAEPHNRDVAQIE